MEEQLAKYEMQIECANRDLSRLRADYDKILEENLQLRGRSGGEQNHSAFW